jgi:hypothetical protein
MSIDRRLFLVGAPLVGLGAAAGIIAYRASTTTTGTAVEIGDDYETYLAAVAADYRAGKLDVIDGWILSETEVRTYREMLAD